MPLRRSGISGKLDVRRLLLHMMPTSTLYHSSLVAMLLELVRTIHRVDCSIYGPIENSRPTKYVCHALIASYLYANNAQLPDPPCGITSVGFSVSGRLLFAGYDDYECKVHGAPRIVVRGTLR